jgi:succinate dehydrogenase / fumarate reductase flavoprotein subunit
VNLDAREPSGPLADMWDTFRFENKLLAPSNKRSFRVIVVGTGLAGAGAAATLAEQGYDVVCFSHHDSPRRAHSVAAQGGINAAKNYQNDGDSVFRLFYDTVKGGDFRSRESNVYRLSQVSEAIIDQCVAQGVPFTREYGGLLANRSFGGAQVSRTFYCRGQTGQQLLLGAYAALNRQIARGGGNKGGVTMLTRREMLDLIVVDGRARGIVVRNMVTGELEAHTGAAVVLATGGYSNVFYLSTNAMGSNCTAAWRAHRHGALFANPCYTQIHPTCIPVSGEHQSKLTLMSESLRNDGRVWAPIKKGDQRAPSQIPESERDYYLERKYPSFGNLAPRDIASRGAKEVCDEERGIGPGGRGVYLDFKDAIARLGRDAISARYGNLFDMYQRITGESAYEVPFRIYPAPHYTMGGLWVDYHLMSNLDGLFVIGEANFSDHGANRLGASALMQGLADGYFVLPGTIAPYLAAHKNLATLASDAAPCKEAIKATQAQLDKLLAIKGKRTVASFHRELGRILWDHCGLARDKAGLTEGIEKVRALRGEFWENVQVPGSSSSLNPALEEAQRVADFLELGEVMCRDGLTREESAGAHFRTEHQTDDNEARRNDEAFCHVAAWEFKGADEPHERHVEELEFSNVKLATRSYK